MAIVGIFPLFPVRNQGKGFIGIGIPCPDDPFGAGGQCGQLLSGEYDQLHFQTVFSSYKPAVQNTGPGMALLVQTVQFCAQPVCRSNVHQPGIASAAGASIRHQATVIQYWKL